MKKYILFFILVFALFSCDDFLEEDLSSVMLATSPSMQTIEGLESALPGAYKSLTWTWTMGFSSAATWAVLMGADDATTTSAGDRAEFREFDQFNPTNLNPRLNFVWDGAYKCIQSCNFIIDGYPNAYGSGRNDDVAQIAGEAYFLRGFCYFWLARLWEDVPLLTESHIFTEDYLTMLPSKAADVYPQILADMDSAIALMEPVRVADGRASRASAYAVKAKALLQMTGWPLNQTNRYAEAAAAARHILDNLGTYQLSLLPDFADLWLAENDGNSEEVFALTHEGSTAPSDNTNGLAIYGASALPQDVPGAWADRCAELTFFNNFPDQPRKNATFLTEVTVSGFVIDWEDFIYPRPFFEKFTIPTGVAGTYTTTWDNDKSNPIERLAEVYLVFAEAQFMATGNATDADALEALNTINRRAWGEPLDTPGANEYTTLTQDIIVQEKAWELAGEFSRWFDICRLQMLDEIISEKDADDWQPEGRNYWLPVPNRESTVNPNL